MLWAILKRAARVAIPLLGLSTMGYLETNTATVFFVPVLNALGKALRDRFPNNSTLDNLLPF